MYCTARSHTPRRPLNQCRWPSRGLYLPKRASPTPRPMTIARINPIWNVLDVKRESYSTSGQTRETTHITVSMKKMLILARTTCIIPRGTSYVRIKGSAQGLCESHRGCAACSTGMLRSSDVATIQVLSLFARAIWALHKQCISRAWDNETNAEPRAPVCLHDCPHHGQPSLSDREHENPDTRSNHCARRSGCPTDKPEVIAYGEVEVHYHVAHIHGHSLVHVHDHAIIVGESSHDQKRG